MHLGIQLDDGAEFDLRETENGKWELLITTDRTDFTSGLLEMDTATLNKLAAAIWNKGK